MVREAVGSALPKPRKKTERPRWKLKPAVDFIDAVLGADRKAPRKQRHQIKLPKWAEKTCQTHQLYEASEFSIKNHSRRSAGPDAC
jgi:hypothetical protein